MLKLALPALAGLTLSVGCAHTKAPTTAAAKADDGSSQQKENAPAASMKPEQIAGSTAKTERDASPAEAKAHDQLAAAVAELSKVKVFFDYDDSTLTKEGEEHLVRVGNILAKHPRLRIRIEGNCDERGTDEYNLALGQRRAESARKYLSALGAQPAQIETISYGAERPAVDEHHEQAWKQNRRDDIVVIPGLN
jgi:peptidoglycan-associated lipoprotein